MEDLASRVPGAVFDHLLVDKLQFSFKFTVLFPSLFPQKYRLRSAADFCGDYGAWGFVALKWGLVGLSFFHTFTTVDTFLKGHRQRGGSLLIVVHPVTGM